MRFAGRIAVSVVALAVVLMILPSHSLAQGRGGGGRGGFGGGGGGTLNLVQQQEVQKEIELTQDQLDQLQELGNTIRDEIRDKMQSSFQGLRDLSDDERQARMNEIRTQFEEINKDAEARMQKVLMPHQFERLKQIEVQSRLQRGGAARSPKVS